MFSSLRFASETEQDYISSELNAKLTNVRSAVETLLEKKQEVRFLVFRPAGLTLRDLPRWVDPGFVPVLFNQPLFKAHDVEVIPLVFAVRIVRIFRRPVP